LSLTSILTFAICFIFFPTLQLLILKCCRFYNTFGSGASHGIYAQFIAQSTQLNNGRAIGLLRGTGTRMATFFYAMLRLVRLKDALKATVNTVKFRELLKSATNLGSIRECVADLESPSFFTALYVLLRAVYPALRVLRYCDSNEPMMDKLYYLSYRATEALKKSVVCLDDEGTVEIWTAEAEMELNYEEEQAEIDAEAEDRFVMLSFTLFMSTYHNLTLTVSQ
jgi:hypothetical protein